ncbi:MAG: hypothetical protein EOO77_29320 [Oxalobacteraceae bacterium]|nr:MAG: hypothetical protein EOO77_29320 [Oxalobacteraceae bacterium]
MFNNLTRRRVSVGRGWRFDIHDDGLKFAELRPNEGRWSVKGSHVELAYCMAARVHRLPVGATEVEALQALRQGTADYIRNEDDTAEMFDESMHAMIAEYRHLRGEYEIEVDSDCMEILKPTVDRLRVVERQLHLLPYVIRGAVYDGDIA